MFKITFANPKGGSGKTTSAILLAEQIAKAGASVAVLDCDPNQNIMHWQKDRTKAGRETAFEVIPAPDEESFMDTLVELEDRFDYLVLDLEGTASQLVTYATSQSDLVVIPFEPTPMEARQAARAIKLVRSTSKMMKREIAHTLLVTRANAAFATTEEKDIRKETDESKIPVMRTSLVRRSAYTRIFRDGALLDELLEDAKTATQNSSKGQRERTLKPLRKAIQNAQLYSQEILGMLGEMEDAA